MGILAAEATTLKHREQISMSSDRIIRRLAVISALAGAFGTTPAAATTWPLSILGNWNMVANRTSIMVVISTQATTGQCNLIGGVMYNLGTAVYDGLQGTYCPDSGAIVFRRMHAGTN